MSGARIIDGKAFAAGLRERVGAAAAAFAAEAGRQPGLAVVLVGEDPASAVYVRSKGKATVAANMASFEHRLAADASQADLEACAGPPDKTTALTPVDGTPPRYAFKNGP